MVTATRDERLELRLASGEMQRLRRNAEQAGLSLSETARRGIAQFTTAPRPTYSLDGTSEYSFVRDVWMRAHPNEGGDPEAAKYRLAQHQAFMADLAALVQFTTVTTSNASQIVPPGYEPLLADFGADRALWNAVSHGECGAAPFVVPAALSEAGIGSAVAAQTEGSPPVEGTLGFTAATATPVPLAGEYTLSRQLADSSNPSVDAIAMQAMQEDWARQFEGLIFTELNNAQSGTITGDQVPNGAMARTSAGAALPQDLASELLLFPNYRKAAPRRVVASTRSTVSTALSTLNLTLLPFQDVDIAMSWAISGTAAGDGDVFILGTGDVWAWSSPLLKLTYPEKAGPQTIQVSLWGYAATRVIKPLGVASIRHT
jgi:hypothetical protein